MIGLIKSVLGTTPDHCYHIYSCLKSTSTLCYTFQYTNILWFIQYHLFDHTWDTIVFYFAFAEFHRKLGVHKSCTFCVIISSHDLTQALR